MRELLERAWRAYQTPTGKRMFRYTMVSVISTAVSLSVIFLVFGVLQLLGQVGSAIVGNTVATVPSYYLNRKWAWGKSGRSHLVKEVLPFWAASFAGLVLSIGAAQWAKEFTKAHHFHHFGATVIVLGANFTAYGLLWVGKFLIFNKLFHHAHGRRVEVEVELVEP
jgi:putative flippase GtrA